MMFSIFYYVCLRANACFVPYVKVFGLGMAGRVVVEGASYPRGLLIEAYIPVCSERWVITVPYNHPLFLKPD